MNRNHTDKNAARRPGQRPDGREREELLIAVERAVIGGATTPAQALAAVPALGTWDTARSYLDEVRARWGERAERAALREARGSMVAALRVARERALAMMEQAEKPAEVVRLCREVERLVRCEAWLLGLEPKKLDAGAERDPDAEELDRFLDSLEADLGITRDEELESELGTPIPEPRSPIPENGEDPSPARTEPAPPAAVTTASAP